MQDKCPKCGETLITKTIKKELGHGSIDYPVSQTCPKCNWNIDLTGAADIISKPVIVKVEETKKENVKPPSPPKKAPQAVPSDINKFIPVALAILVLGAIAWAFFLSPGIKEETGGVPTPIATPEPSITTVVPVVTTIATPETPEVTPSGNSIPIKLDSRRGFYPRVQSIKAGDEIVFNNLEKDTITLVSSDGLFDPQVLPYDRKFRIVFTKSGNYTFYFKENENLTGTIVVEP